MLLSSLPYFVGKLTNAESCINISNKRNIEVKLPRRHQMAEGIVNLTSATWDSEVIQYKGVVLVDFWAPWCGPCRMIAPTLEELAAEYAGKAKIAKVNTDENSEIAGKFKIMSIPTLLFFKDGVKVDQVVGAVPKPQLKSKIDALLA
jgi:thioredoxin 1